MDKLVKGKYKGKAAAALATDAALFAGAPERAAAHASGLPAPSALHHARCRARRARSWAARCSDL